MACDVESVETNDVRQGLEAHGLTISTWPVAGSSVFQFTVAPEVVIFVTEMPETTGGVLSVAPAPRTTSTQKFPAR